jgi:DNA polymerase IIIc chi subunit
MTKSSKKVIFFKVEKPFQKIERIVNVSKYHFVKNHLLIFFVPNKNIATYLDDLLWKTPKMSFLPHIVIDEKLSNDKLSSDNIIITTNKSLLSSSDEKLAYVFNLCTAPLEIDDFRAIYEFEDKTDPGKYQKSQDRYRAYKDKKLSIESY